MTHHRPNPNHDAPEARGAGGGPPDTALDRYLDNLMTEAERAQFEQRLAGDDALGRQVTLQRRIDDDLRARFAPPARITLPASPASGHDAAGDGDRPIPISPARGAGMPRWALGLAASVALLCAAGGVGYWWLAVGSPAPFRQPGEIYAGQLAAGFTPEWVCTTDEEFAGAVRERFGEAAVLPLGTQGVQIVGWAYNTPVLSNQTATLITRVEGREVLVLIDRAGRDVNLRRTGGQGLAGSEGLRLFKRRVGGLVLYEVTPLDRPRVLPAFVPGA